MHPSIIRTLSTGNMRGSFTITTIGRNIGSVDRGCWPEKRLRHAKTLKEILAVNIREEEGAIQLYGSILEVAGTREQSSLKQLTIFLKMNRNTKKN
jgi:hypothetical protein